MARALRQTFPDAKIGWAVHPHCAPILEGNPDLDEIHLIPRKKFFREFPRAILPVRREKYDIAIDLQGLMKSGLVTKLSSAPKRIGPVEAKEGARMMYNFRVARDNANLHVVDGYLKLAEAAGAKVVPAPQMVLPDRTEDKLQIDNLLSEIGIVPADRLIVLNPSAGRDIKQWPAERFGELAHQIRSKFDAKFLITGAPADAHLAERILSAFPDAINLTGKTSLTGMGELLRRVELFVGGDTGPMHMAQAASTRVVAIFGPTNPKTLGPTLPIHRVAYNRQPCSPCRHRECPIGRPCLNDLGVQDVYQLCAEILQELD